MNGLSLHQASPNNIVVPPIKCAVTENNSLERLDLSDIITDKSFSIHKNLKWRVQMPEFNALIIVIDLEHVYITEPAKVALIRYYLTACYLLDKFGAQVKATLFLEATRGSLKGTTYINRIANEYRYVTGDAMDIVVIGICGVRDGKITREVHIQCSAEVSASTKISNEAE